MKVRLTQRARADLVDIARYTEERWSKRQRDVYLGKLEQRFNWLARNPELGIIRSDIKSGYFCYPQGRHLIFYLRTANTIDIIGIPHKQMDVVYYFGQS